MIAVIVRINGWEKIIEIDSDSFKEGHIRIPFPSKVNCIDYNYDVIAKNATFPIFECRKTGDIRSGMYIFESR